MKKYIKLYLKIIIFIIFISSINISFAETKASCQIKDWQPDIIKEYLKNLRNVTWKIITEANKTTNNPKSLAQSNSEMLWLYNLFTSWNNYWVEWNFWLKEPIFNNVPKEFYRDTKLLSNEIKKLDNIMSRLTKRWALKNKISSNTICNWLTNCKDKLADYSWDALIQLITSTRNIKEIIQRAWANQKNKVKLCDNVLLISKQSCLEIYTIYKNAKQDCQDDKTEKRISDINFNFRYSEEWLQAWKDAWALLLWPDWKNEKELDEYHKLEKELLKKELDRQWIWWDQAKQILKNLDEYNYKSTWYTLTNNPISNIVKTINNAIDPETKSELSNFLDSIADVFKDKETNEVPISELVELTKKNQQTNISKFDIIKIYNEQLPLAQMQDLDTSEIVGKILDMNHSVSVSINTLDKAIPLSKKVCNAQWQWDTPCEY